MNFPKVITIACEKGGVGKTTIATNLAVYLKAMREDLPVTLFSFDNHFTVDRMLSIKKKPHDFSVQHLFDGVEVEKLVELGQYGVGFIPSSRRLDSGDAGIDHLSNRLSESALGGIIIMDTRPTLDYFTKSALLASDMVIVPVKDLPSLNNIKGMTDFYEESGVKQPEILLLPSIVDGMVKFKNNTISMDQFLRFLATERDYTLLKASIPKSPKVESLNTNIAFEVYPVINHARSTQVHQGFASVTKEVLGKLDALTTPKAWLSYRTTHFHAETENDRKYKQLIQSVVPYCPLCAEEITTPDFHIKPGMFYFESGTQMKGFIDRECLQTHFFKKIENGTKEENSFTAELKKELGKDKILCIAPQGQGGDGSPTERIALSLYDPSGERLANTSLDKKTAAALSSLLPDITEATPVGPAPCIVKLGYAPFPDALFFERNYHAFQDGKMKALLDSGASAAASRMVTEKRRT